jgi:hypothetical protein
MTNEDAGLLDMTKISLSEIENLVLKNVEEYTYIEFFTARDIQLRDRIEELVITRGRNYWIMEESVRVFGPKKTERR